MCPHLATPLAAISAPLLSRVELWSSSGSSCSRGDLQLLGTLSALTAPAELGLPAPCPQCHVFFFQMKRRS